MKTALIPLVILVLLSSAGCHLFLEERGSEGEPCSSEGTCIDDLVCVDDICVSPEDGDTSDGDTTDCQSQCEGRCGDFNDCNCGECDSGWHCESALCISDGPCETDSDCGENICTPDTCEYADEECSEEGERAIICSVPVCDNGGCTATEDIRVEGCNRPTEGNSCTTANGSGGTCQGSFCVSGGDDPIWEDGNFGLVWQISIPERTLTWDDASEYCENLEYGGLTDWSLPDISELRTLVDGCEFTALEGSCGVRTDCLSQDCYFGGVTETPGCQGCGDQSDGTCYFSEALEGPCGEFWSRSEMLQEDVTPDDTGDDVIVVTDSAWLLNYSTAELAWSLKIDDKFVRCVRGVNVFDPGK